VFVWGEGIKGHPKGARDSKEVFTGANGGTGASSPEVFTETTNKRFGRGMDFEKGRPLN